MNSYLAKLSELNKVKNQNETLEKIIQTIVTGKQIGRAHV